MTDYRFVMGLLLQGYAYRQIEAMAGCSHRAIARARRVLDEEGFTTREQVDGLLTALTEIPHFCSAGSSGRRYTAIV